MTGGTTRAVLVGILACSVLFGGSFLIGEARPLTASAPTLGKAASFGVLGGSSVTNTGNTTVHGDVGVDPGSSITGFGPGQSGVIVNGSIHGPEALTVQAQDDNAAAFTNLGGQGCTLDLTGKDLGTVGVLVPGVYCFTSSAGLTGTLHLDDTSNGIFIFKIVSALTTASASQVSLTGGSGCNVFWQVGSQATLGSGSHLEGNILAGAAIVMNTRASLSGRALAARAANVTMDTNLVDTAACASGTTPDATFTPTSTATAVPAATSTPTATARATATATAAPAAGQGSASTPRPAPTADLGPEASPAATLPAQTATAVAVATLTAVAILPAATQTAVAAAGSAGAVPAAGAEAAPAAAASTATPAPTSAAVATATALTSISAETSSASGQATETPTAVSAESSSTSAQAAETPTPPAAIPTSAVSPPAQVPSTLPRTGGGPPPLGLVALLLGGVALAAGLTLRRK